MFEWVGDDNNESTDPDRYEHVSMQVSEDIVIVTDVDNTAGYVRSDVFEEVRQ